MNQVHDRVVIVAQLLLSIFFIAGYFACIAMFMLGHAKVPLDYKEAFIGFLGVCTGAVVTIVAFWFNRSRQAGAEPPQLDSEAIAQELMKRFAAQPTQQRTAS